MENNFSTIIIGAGPAGLMAAISSRESAPNHSTLIIEKGSTPGRKLLITAAGQCNITHRGSTEEILSHYNKKERFLRAALFALTNTKLIHFFESRGVPLSFDEKGRSLPQSLNAHDILRTLTNTCRDNNIKFHFNDPVQSILPLQDSPESTDSLSAGITQSSRFIIKTKERSFTAKKVIIATGGKSFPKTGSNGDGYRLAESLGHSIINPIPALTGIIVKKFELPSLAGISFNNISIDLYRHNKKITKLTGDLLITHKGISGPIIINNTRDIREGDLLKLNFTDKSREEILLDIKQATLNGGKKTISTYLKTYNIPKKLIAFLCLNPEKSLSQLRKEERIDLLSRLSAYPVTIDQIQGFNTAMVTAGGINTKEINPKTMESRLVKGLYFAGEVIDIDGDSGGYNLQAAFSTGNLAGKESPF